MQQRLRDDLGRATHVLAPELLREMYRCGLELGVRESAVFHLELGREESLALVVRNGRDGVVDVVCPDDRVAAELRSFVGFRVSVASDPEASAPFALRTLSP